MMRRLIFGLSLAAISAHAETPDLQSQIDELRRIIHVQSESINELSRKDEMLKKAVTVSLESGKMALETHKESLLSTSQVVQSLEKEIVTLKQTVGLLWAHTFPKSDR